MHSSKSILIAMISTLTIALSGCAATGWKVGAKCSSGAGCEVSGEITGTFQQQNILDPIAKSIASTFDTGLASIPDASLFVIDTSGTTISLPGSGNVTLMLVQSGTGNILAARTFSWIRSGTELVLADPAAVNAWAETNGDGADSLQYELAPIPASASTGLNTFAVQAVYANEVKASSTFSWTAGGSDCRNCMEK